MLSLEFTPVLWHAIAVSKGDDQRFCQVSGIGDNLIRWIRHYIRLPCPRHLQRQTDELGIDQGLLWLQLLGLRTFILNLVAVVRVNLIAEQDVAEKISPLLGPPLMQGSRPSSKYFGSSSLTNVQADICYDDQHLAHHIAHLAIE